MTVTPMLEFGSLFSDLDTRPADPVFSSTVEQDIKARVHELLLLMYRPSPAMEQRRDRRYPYPHLVRLTPVADDGCTPTGATVMVAGSTLSEGGFGFYHPEPLPNRRMIASFHAGDNRWVGLLVDLRWCRFVGQGWYESGGKFLRPTPASQPETSMADA